MRELLIKNNGPIRNLHLIPTFTEEGNPIPHVIVGRNGTGKTNLLSLIGDALMEGASVAYSDILKTTGLVRSYFRVVGGKTIAYGEPGSYSIFRFDHEGTEVFYHEATARMDPADLIDDIPTDLAAGANWNTGSEVKNFAISEKKAREIYGGGIYAFFPASRSENPFWFNQDALSVDLYENRDRYTQNLDRPIYVEHGIDTFTQWLLGAITESRLDPSQTKVISANEERITVELDTPSFRASQAPLTWANKIIRIILDDPSANFHWAGRKSSRKAGISSAGKLLVASLDGLSGGQSTLLAIFGTILRYLDETGSARGIVVIDELDAHMHIDLQMKALPQLVGIFPEIQFIFSSHSPLFALGMEQHFSPTGVRILEMPTGQQMYAEGYQEFEHALAVLIDTQAFARAVEERVTANEDPAIFLAGQTDLLYFRTAARLLGFDRLVERFSWIGEDNERKGGANTGDRALNSAISFLKANPDITSKTIVAVYDCDANKSDEHVGNIHVIALPTLPDREIQKGIENMLPDSVFLKEFYDDKIIPNDYGPDVTKPELNKMKLCQSLCGDDAVAATFSDFRQVLERIDSILPESENPSSKTDTT